MAKTKTTHQRSASRKKATPRKKTTKKPSTPKVSSQRKTEILGVILMALAVLLSLALLTYQSADDALARDFSFGALFEPGATGQPTRWASSVRCWPGCWYPIFWDTRRCC